MTLTLVKTSSETAMAEAFDDIGAKLPGGRAVGDLRRAAMTQFRAAGLPHRRIEAWKFTDLRARFAVTSVVAPAAPVVPLAAVEAALGPFAALEADRIVLVDGVFIPALSRMPTAKGIEVVSLAHALGQSEAIAERLAASGVDDIEEGAAAIDALNTAFMSDGVVVRVAAGASLSAPVVIASITSQKAPHFKALRNVISVGAGARATFVEVHALANGARAGQTSVLTALTLDDGAVVDHVVAALEGAPSTMLNRATVEIGAEATYRTFQLTPDAALARHQAHIKFRGEGGKLDASGVMLARDKSHVDTTLVIDHAVPACESREFYRTVLDHEARSVFQGKVIVRPDAQKTDGKQMAQALMLSETAEFDAKPELEIYADDVVCGHGATSAEIDADMMFYLRSRGIPKEVARAMILESFIGEVVEKVQNEAIRIAVGSACRRWLERA
jgi:Fe-S cluster assembly protein SufD